MPKLYRIPPSFFLELISIIPRKRSEAEGGEKDDLDSDTFLTPDPTPEDGTIKKVNEIEGRVSDLKTQMDGISSSNKSIKGDLDGIKKDLSEINNTIKDLLSVYEVVNKEYNPFVEPETQPVKKSIAREFQNAVGNDSNLHVIPYKEKEPIERVVKPTESEREFTKEERGERMQQTTKIAESRADALADSNFCLFQYLKLVEFQLEKLYNAKVDGQGLSDEEVDVLYKWLGEYKRLLVK